MTRAEEYRRRANQAEEQADETRNPSTKQYLMGAAREWRELANQAERHRGRKMSERGDEPKRDQPPNKMTREEAERLRALLRGTKAADLNDPFARQRVGRAIAQAIDRGPPKLGPSGTNKERDRR